MELRAEGAEDGKDVLGMSNFYTDVICKDSRFGTEDNVRDMALLEPVTRASVQAILADALEQGIHLLPTETYRSAERQTRLYCEGKTEIKEVGVHHFGLACDFCKIVAGKPTWEGDWTFLCLLAVKHGMISGYDWGRPEMQHSFRDEDHVQRVGIPDQARLFAGTWYPEETFVPATGSYPVLRRGILG